MKFTNIQINAADGTLLLVRHSIPRDFSELAILVHGMGEHSARYAEVAGFFNERGIAVFTYDQRGHGVSGGRRTHIESFNDYISDLLIVSKKAKEMTGKDKFLLLGHSMGGLVSTVFAGRKPDLLKGLVLSSPFFGVAMKVPAYKTIPGRFLSSIYPTLSMATGLDTSLLSHDQNVVNNYTNDPLVIKTVTTRWFTETTSALLEAKDAVRKFTFPLLVMQAGSDGLVSPEATREAIENAGSKSKEFHMLEGFYHEIFNEVKRAVPFGILDRWLKAQGLTKSQQND